MLKGKGSGILLGAKPPGRPSASAVSIRVSPGERNPIEGKFGRGGSPGSHSESSTTFFSMYAKNTVRFLNQGLLIYRQLINNQKILLNLQQKVQEKMKETRKSRAFNAPYESTRQLVLSGFETPFERELDKRNRWVVLSHLIPWDEICGIYLRKVPVSTTGRPAINPRIVLGSLIIKYLCHLDDRETVDQISENVYMQYFLGYSSFTSDKPFDASLFVDFRKELGLSTINEINEKIVSLKTQMVSEKETKEKETKENKEGESSGSVTDTKEEEIESHKGKIIFDATCCPQDIAYPTDLDLLSDAREKAEKLIDIAYRKSGQADKPRTYRKKARKLYLATAQKKNKSKKVIRRAIREQLQFLRRDIAGIHQLLDGCQCIPFKKQNLKYFYVIQTLYEQQFEMYKKGVHTVEDRIVSIHQPHVRPIVRGKARSKVEFGSKIHVSVIDGISFLDELSWDAFNEGSRMEASVEMYKKRFGFYPKEVSADRIYCTRFNRNMLKRKGILLKAKPLGRPSALSIHVSPGERNPIEGKFGQAKRAYGLDRIKARLKETSESWIAGIFMVLNLVKLAGAALPCLVEKSVVEYIQKKLRRVNFYAVRWDMNMDSYSLAPLWVSGV